MHRNQSSNSCCYCVIMPFVMLSQKLRTKYQKWLRHGQVDMSSDLPTKWSGWKSRRSTSFGTDSRTTYELRRSDGAITQAGRGHGLGKTGRAGGFPQSLAAFRESPEEWPGQNGRIQAAGGEVGPATEAGEEEPKKAAEAKMREYCGITEEEAESGTEV
jgi:hypothetical protein